jgi:hypothetical protein
VNSYFYELRVASFLESWDEGEFLGGRVGGGPGGIKPCLNWAFKKHLKTFLQN